MNGHRHSSRIDPIPDSIFTTISSLASEYHAVNLGQGFPDFDGPEWIMDAARSAMAASKNQYAPSIGTRSLRQAIGAYRQRFYDQRWEPDKEITATAGATEALFASILALVQEGDEVILLEPFYDSYWADVVIAGGIPKCVTLRKPAFRLDPDALEQSVTAATKLLIVNTPHNPTGRVFDRDELAALADFAIRHDLLVLCDEVYEFLTFDDARHFPLSTFHGMEKRTITISSTGKTFGLTGWKIGYVHAHEPFSRRIRTLHEHLVYAVNTPCQHAMAHALHRLDEYRPEFQRTYRMKRDTLRAALLESRFQPHRSEGTYFMLVDIPAQLGMRDVECARRLIVENGVATIPPSPFYRSSSEGESMLRLCFAKTQETLTEAAERLRSA